MLRALGERLRALALDPRNHFSSAIRRLMGPREAVRYGQPLRRMILAMPAMITQLRRWSDGSGRPPRVLRMQRFALAYLYDPIDFFRASSSGLFRYLDDAYLLARIYHLTLRERDASGRKNHGDDPAISKAVPEWIDLARRLLPRETSRIDELLDEAARGDAGLGRRRKARLGKG